MSALLERLKASSFARELLKKCNFAPAGSRVNCAVSGGQDSMAMLLLATLNGCKVRAIHVDHSIRAGSQNESKVVADVAKLLGADFESHTVKVEPGANLEARAREVRYAVLPKNVATGHTVDDQAETLIINMLRGAGLQGLAAMQPGFNRPILGLRRSDTARLCREMEIDCVEDSSNSDLRFLRNQIRHRALPLLDEIAQRDVTAVLARQAEIFRQDSEVLDELANQIDPTDARSLADAPIALARRAVRRWLTEIYPPDAATVERVLEVARGNATACDIGMNREVRRSQQRLQINKMR